MPGGARDDAILDFSGNAPALEQARQGNAAGPGGIAELLAASTARAHRVLVLMSGRGAAGTHGNRHTRMHQIDLAADQHVAGSDELVDGVRGRRKTTSKASPLATRRAASTPPTDSMRTSPPPCCRRASASSARSRRVAMEEMPIQGDARVQDQGHGWNTFPIVDTERARI
jgi:hypothetical protein